MSVCSLEWHVSVCMGCIWTIFYFVPLLYHRHDRYSSLNFFVLMMDMVVPYLHLHHLCQGRHWHKLTGWIRIVSSRRIGSVSGMVREKPLLWDSKLCKMCSSQSIMTGRHLVTWTWSLILGGVLCGKLFSESISFLEIKTFLGSVDVDCTRVIVFFCP